MKPATTLLPEAPFFQTGRAYRVHLFSMRFSIKIHVLAVIDRDQIVYKFFGRQRQWWHYGIHDCDTLKACFERVNNPKIN
jgi:hypothetical protein